MQPRFLFKQKLKGMKKMSELNITERTSTITKTIRKENYENGIYFICLNINGKNIDSKKVIFK